MSKKYDLVIYICRSQPFHNGHFMLVHKALALADQVLILVGSADQSRTATKDPFTFEERRQMIHGSFDDSVKYNIQVSPIRSYLYDDQRWITEVNRTVQRFVEDDMDRLEEQCSIALIGHFRDSSSKYLDWFPTWKLVEEDEVPVGLSATGIRDIYLNPESCLDVATKIEPSVPTGTRKFLLEFSGSPEYQLLKEEYKFIKKYQETWKRAPYPVIFSTTDAIVVTTGYVLLVTRKATPGKGLIALPGGFTGYAETLEDSAIRELREETGIKIPTAVLKGSMKGFKVFDNPDRSQRGRTITNAFYIELEPAVIHDKGPDGLPKVKGGDDAAHAKWYRIDQLDELRPLIFEDHFDIITYFVGSHKS